MKPVRPQLRNLCLLSCCTFSLRYVELVSWLTSQHERKQHGSRISSEFALCCISSERCSLLWSLLSGYSLSRNNLSVSVRRRFAVAGLFCVSWAQCQTIILFNATPQAVFKHERVLPPSCTSTLLCFTVIEFSLICVFVSSLQSFNANMVRGSTWGWKQGWKSVPSLSGVPVLPDLALFSLNIDLLWFALCYVWERTQTVSIIIISLQLVIQADSVVLLNFLFGCLLGLFLFCLLFFLPLAETSEYE